MPTGTKAGKGALPYLSTAGELVIPQDSMGRYKHWQRATARPGRMPFTVPQILAELNAPLSTWKRHTYAADLSPAAHAKFCKGTIQQGDGFVFCTDCARHQEQ